MIKKEQILEGLELTKQYILDSLIVNEQMKKTTGQQQVIEDLEKTIKDILENIESLQSDVYRKYLLSQGFLNKEDK